MNDTPQPQNHVRFVCGCVTVLAFTCALVGGFLLWKGYAGGEVLASQIGVAIGGMLGVLSQQRGTAVPAKAEPQEPETNPKP